MEITSAIVIAKCEKEFFLNERFLSLYMKEQRQEMTNLKVEEWKWRKLR